MRSDAFTESEREWVLTFFAWSIGSLTLFVFNQVALAITWGLVVITGLFLWRQYGRPSPIDPLTRLFGGIGLSLSLYGFIVVCALPIARCLTDDFFCVFLSGLCFTAFFALLSLILIAFPGTIPFWIRSSPRRLMPAAAILGIVAVGCWFDRSDLYLRSVFKLHHADFNALAQIISKDGIYSNKSPFPSAEREAEYERLLKRVGLPPSIEDSYETVFIVRNEDAGAAFTAYVFSSTTEHSGERNGAGYDEYREYIPLGDGWYILHQSYG